MFSNRFSPPRAWGRGTGLGLATVYGIVKQNKGFIYIYSEPGQGTTLKIYLPRHAGQNGTAHRQDTPEVPPGRNETILLVEDEVAFLKLGTMILERLGYIVLPAATPNEALNLAAEHGDEIDLLVTDVIMPEMNGRVLADRLQRRQPGLKTLFISGYTADVIAHRGVLKEGVCFMQKPFSREQLAQKVRQALDRPHQA